MQRAGKKRVYRSGYPEFDQGVRALQSLHSARLKVTTHESSGATTNCIFM